jgi:hypothetical protein
MSKQIAFNMFHTNTNSPGTGKQVNVDYCNIITLEITSTGNATVVFEGSIGNGNFYPLQAIRLSDFSNATGTTGSNLGELWTLDISALVHFRVRVTSVSGTVSVNGVMINS